MKTEVIKIDQNNMDTEALERAAAIIRDGGLVAFPTETVYGLGADALSAEASKKIYAAKGRPSDNPLIVHVAEFSDMEKIAQEMPEEAKKLADAFWPGPLTMIVRKNDKVPYETTGDGYGGSPHAKSPGCTGTDQEKRWIYCGTECQYIR